MLAALVMIAALGDWAPVRWISSDPASLDLLRATRFNCVLLEPRQWNAALVARAHERGIAAAGVVSSRDEAARAAALKLDALVVESESGGHIAAALPVIELVARRALAASAGGPVVGTWQGVWPGINAAEEGAVAGPTSTPWFDTNSGFLRWLRVRTRAQLWMANRPPAGTVYPPARYLQAMADAALAGARWVVALDGDLARRLAARDAGALRDWKQICAFADFLEEHGEWRRWPSYGSVGLLEGPDEGALISGGVLDMMAVQHIPVRAVTANAASGVRLLVNLSGKPAGAPAEVTPAPGWKFPIASPEQFAIRKADLPKLEDLRNRVNRAAGRQNFGIRLFNGSGMLSHPVISPDGKRLAIPIVNYTGFAAEGITVHVLGAWKRARLLMPGHEARELHLYPIDGGSGVEIARLEVMAILELTSE